VLVTGATGMVGSWLVKDLLAADTDVVALVRDADPRSELFRSGDFKRISIVNGALEQLNVVERAVLEYDPAVVFHLAAQTTVGPALQLPLATFESNIRGTYHLLDVCRRHAGGIRAVVIASSDKAYGIQSQLPYKEATSLDGRFPYEVSKVCADLLAQSYH